MKKKTTILIIAVAVVALLALVPAASAGAGMVGAVLDGNLYVTSSPSNATVNVYLSDDYGLTYKYYDQNSTPCTFTTVPSQNENKLKVVISKPGYYSQTKYVTGTNMGGGKTYSVHADLELIPVVNDGFISITSSPSNAMIYVDGIRYGSTPNTVTVDGNVTHTVKLVKSGYLSQTKSVYVPAGGTSSVSMTLESSTTYGYLAVSSNPSVANIYIDGVYKGQTPMTITLPTGNHTLALSKSGYTGFSKTVTVYEGATSSVYGVLAENVTSAYVNVTSTPNGASVYIDGEYIGVTPSTGALSKEVKANTQHTLTVKATGYETYNSTFTLETGQIEAFSPTLIASGSTTGTINITSVPSGALIYIDNEYVGSTPAVHTVSAGTHTVKLASLGYNDSINTVTVSAGQSVPLQVTMIPGSTPSTKSPFPVLGILIGLGAAAVFAGRKLRR